MKYLVRRALALAELRPLVPFVVTNLLIRTENASSRYVGLCRLTRRYFNVSFNSLTFSKLLAHVARFLRMSCACCAICNRTAVQYDVCVAPQTVHLSFLLHRPKPWLSLSIHRKPVRNGDSASQTTLAILRCYIGP